MDPLRRLLLLGLLASVILAEPGSARAAATMADLAGRHTARDAAAVLAGQMVQRLAASLLQDEQDTRPADVDRRVQAKRIPQTSRPSCLAQVGIVHAILSPHEFRPPPPTTV